MTKKLIGVLKKITEKPKKINAVPLDSDNLNRCLNILSKNEDFKKFKKEFFKLRDYIANRVDLNEDQANSIMNYCIHHDKK